MSKKVLIAGLGVQGNTVAKLIDDVPTISEIIVADINQKAIDDVLATIKKGKGLILDAQDQDSIVKAMEGVDVVVNAMPVPVMMPILYAAIEAKIDYLDFNALYDYSAKDHIKAYGEFVEKYDKIFKDIGRTFLGGSGSSPGLTNAIARYTMRFLDTCDSIMTFINEGLRTERFIPFWWSPEIALDAMNKTGKAVLDGKMYNTVPYSGPVYRNWPELGRETVFYEHVHPEPATMAYHSEESYKGCKNFYFKYGGAGMDFAKPLYDLGLLSTDPVEFGGGKFAPYDFIESYLPLPPRFPEDIKAIIDEGIIEENSALVVESTGTKNGKKVLVTAHVNAPGLVESYERSGLTSEMYQTGMSGAMFTKMLLDGNMKPGFITSDMFTDEQVDTFLDYISDHGSTVDICITAPIEEENNVIPILD